MAPRSVFLRRPLFALVACLAAVGCLLDPEGTSPSPGPGLDATADGASSPGQTSAPVDASSRAEGGANSSARGGLVASYLGDTSEAPDAAAGDAATPSDAGPSVDAAGPRDAGGPVVRPPEVAPGNPTVTCVRRIFGPGRQFVTGVSVAPDGRIAVVGNISKGNFGLDPAWIDLGNGVVPVGGNGTFVVVYDASCGYLWSRVLGPTTVAAPVGLGDVAFDAAGNLYVGGSTRATVDFGGGPLVPVGHSTIIAKYDPAYSLVFAKKFDFSGQSHPREMGVDAAGNIYLAGALDGTVDFGGGPLHAPVGGGSRVTLYLAKLGADGAHNFSKMFLGTFGPGALENVYFRELRVDPAGNATLLASAPAAASIDLGGGATVSASTEFSFAARFTSAGTHVWSRTVPVAQLGLFANGDVAISTGRSEETYDLGTGPHRAPLILGRLSGSDGAAQWSKGFMPTPPPRSNVTYAGPMAGTAPGGFVLATQFQGTLDLGCGPISSIPYSVGNPSVYDYHDLLLARFSSTGQCLYSMRFGDRENQHSSRVAVAPSGATVLAGGYQGTITFGSTTLPNEEPPVYLPNRQPEDAFVAVFSK